MANFKCSNCNNTKIVSKFRTYFDKGNRKNIDLDSQKEIICEDCKIPMAFVSEKGNFESSYSSFSGLSPIEKQKVLRKRSQDDANKQRYRNQDFEKDHYNA